MIRKYEKATDPFYSSDAWRKTRVLVLNRDHGDCVWCKRAGRWTVDRHGRRVRIRATMVHHIKPLKEYPQMALHMDNLVSLCDNCHDEAHPEKFGQGAKEPPLAVKLGIRVEVIKESG